MKILIEYPTMDKKGVILKNDVMNGSLAGKFVDNEALEKLKKNTKFDSLAELLIADQQVALDVEKKRLDAKANDVKKIRDAEKKTKSPSKKTKSPDNI